MIGDMNVEIPDVAEPIRGYRVFRLETVKGENEETLYVLKSYNGTDWPPNGTGKRRVHGAEHITARCIKAKSLPEHPCPSPPQMEGAHEGMGCGIYAFKELNDLVLGFRLFGMPLRDKGTSGYLVLLYGEIEMWGHVYDHEKGYRAEHAQLKKLYHCPPYGMGAEQLEAVAEQYGVEVEQIEVDVKWIAMMDGAKRAVVQATDPILYVTLQLATLGRLLRNEAKRCYHWIEGRLNG